MESAHCLETATDIYVPKRVKWYPHAPGKWRLLNYAPGRVARHERGGPASAKLRLAATGGITENAFATPVISGIRSPMLRTFLRSKLHRVTVTQADLNYEGSISVDPVLLNAANVAPFELVDIYNITNGNRLSTYAIAGESGSGEICINGAAARLVDPGDLVIICCYGQLHENEIADHKVRVIHVNERNEITEVTESNVKDCFNCPPPATQQAGNGSTTDNPSATANR